VISVGCEELFLCCGCFVVCIFCHNFCRSQYFSPLDDLAFDMYQDPDVAQVIRKLEKKKRDAVSSKYINGIFTLRGYEQK